MFFIEALIPLLARLMQENQTPGQAAGAAPGQGTVLRNPAPQAPGSAGGVGGVGPQMGQSAQVPGSGVLDPNKFNQAQQSIEQATGNQVDFFSGGLLGKLARERTPATAPTSGQAGGGGGSGAGSPRLGADLDAYRAPSQEGTATSPGRLGLFGQRGADTTPLLSRLLLGDPDSDINQDPSALRKILATLLTDPTPEQRNRNTEELMRILEQIGNNPDMGGQPRFR